MQYAQVMAASRLRQTGGWRWAVVDPRLQESRSRSDCWSWCSRPDRRESPPRRIASGLWAHTPGSARSPSRWWCRSSCWHPDLQRGGCASKSPVRGTKGTAGRDSRWTAAETRMKIWRRLGHPERRGNRWGFEFARRSRWSWRSGGAAVALGCSLCSPKSRSARLRCVWSDTERRRGRSRWCERCDTARSCTSGVCWGLSAPPSRERTGIWCRICRWRFPRRCGRAPSYSGWTLAL